MTIKQTLSALGILIVLGGAVGFWASRTTPAPVAEQHILMGTKTADGDYQYSEQTDCFAIKANYPAATGLGAAADVKAREMIETRLKHEIDQFKADNDVSSRDPEQTKALGICGERKFTLEMTYKKYSGSNSVSYFYTVYADSLGAHPNAYFITFVFDENGKVVSIQDVLRTADLTELSLLVSTDVQKQLIARLGDSLPVGAEGPDVTGAMFPEGVAAKEDNFKNFVIDGDTLAIEIPPYQVAAWAAGSFEVRIPLADLAR